MKLSDQETIQLHCDLKADNLTGVSNTNGVFAYFPDEKIAFKFAITVLNTHIRLESLLEIIDISDTDETSYTELEKIASELSFLRDLLK